MNKILFAAVLSALLSVVNHPFAIARAQGTAFTYQGRLNEGTNLATGSYDLRFALYDAATVGAQQGNLLTNSAVDVSNGLFTVTLDFGSQFPGAARWLEIGVRSNGVAAFSVLTPRQPLTPAPYAVFAGSANATNLVGTVSGSQIAAGSIGATQLSNSVSLWNRSGADISYTAGKVGVGTSTPAKALDVTGTASGVATGGSIDPSIFVRVSNTASDGNTSVPDFAGIGFGRTAVQQAIVGGTFGNDFLDFYTGGLLTAPKMRIDINGTVGILTNGVLELGYGVAGKEANAGKIGYEKFTADALDIIGAGTNSSSRKIKFWAEGGAIFNGNVGIGTTSPTAHFHVNGGIFETPVAAALFEVQNCGAACAVPTWTEAVRLMNTEGNLAGLVGMGFLTAPAGSSLTNLPDVWIGTDDKASGNTHSFKIATQSGGVLTNRVFINGATGNVGIGTVSPSTKLEVAGEVTCVAVNITSDRNAKEEFKPVNARAVLAKVVGLPITEWQYKSQADARHIGPMAQDFREAFTLGHDEKHIATVDESGVALAAIQGLNEKLEEKNQEVNALKQSVAALTELVHKLAAKQNGAAQ